MCTAFVHDISCIFHLRFSEILTPPPQGAVKKYLVGGGMDPAKKIRGGRAHRRGGGVDFRSLTHTHTHPNTQRHTHTRANTKTHKTHTNTTKNMSV